MHNKLIKRPRKFKIGGSSWLQFGADVTEGIGNGLAIWKKGEAMKDASTKFHNISLEKDGLQQINPQINSRILDNRINKTFQTLDTDLQSAQYMQQAGQLAGSIMRTAAENIPTKPKQTTPKYIVKPESPQLEQKDLKLPSQGELQQMIQTSIAKNPLTFDISDSNQSQISGWLSNVLNSDYVQKIMKDPRMQLLTGNGLKSYTEPPKIENINIQIPTMEEVNDAYRQQITKNGVPSRVAMGILKSGGRLPKYAEGQKLAQKMQNFNNMFGGGTNGIDMINQFQDSISNAIGKNYEYEGTQGHITQGMDAAYDGLQKGLGKLGPAGQIVSMAMGTGKLIHKALGRGASTDGMTTTDAILGSNFLNLTPLGLINAYGGAQSDKLNDVSDISQSMYGINSLSGFGGTMQNVAGTMKYSDKKYGLFSEGSRQKVNSTIQKLNTQQDQIQDIAAASQDRFDIQSSMSAVNGRATQFDLNGGYQQRAVHVGKQGFKFDDPDDICVFKYKPEIEHPTTIDFFKNGGQMNVIPEGALHARLHHMENGDKLTKKGIPVVDNSGEQQAEIECNEIIFNKEVTEKLEKLWKDGSDEAAIEAGKLLTDEIINNTDDRTGLIETIE